MAQFTDTNQRKRPLPKIIQMAQVTPPISTETKTEVTIQDHPIKGCQHNPIAKFSSKKINPNQILQHLEVSKNCLGSHQNGRVSVIRRITHLLVQLMKFWKITSLMIDNIVSTGKLQEIAYHLKIISIELRRSLAHPKYQRVVLLYIRSILKSSNNSSTFLVL